MTLLAPAGLAALIALPVIALLYFLKVRRREVRVASTVLWRHRVEDLQANAPWQRLRWGPLLLLQLLAAILLAGALVRPGVTGAAGVGRTTVVVLDAGVTMQATDVAPNRFGAAVAEARQLARSLGPGEEMAVVLAGEHARLLAAPTSDAAVIGAALDRARPGATPSDLGEPLSLARALLAGRPGGAIVIFGDGHARAPSAPPNLGVPVRYVAVGTTGENVALEALTQAAGGGVFMRLTNYGRQPRDVRVEMRADGRLVDVVPVRVEGNSSSDARWDGLAPGVSVLEARATPGDAFALDDAAWLLPAAPAARDVLLVTAENGFLERALGLRAGVRVSAVKPADYRPGVHDLYVFDGWVPPGKLPTPALVVHPPEGTGPLPSGRDIDPGAVLPAAPREPLLEGVSLRDVHVQAAARVSTTGGWRTVIAAVDDPLLLVHEGEPRVAELTFDLHHSDLPLRAAFPILVNNLLDVLLPGGFANRTFSLGAAVDLAPEAGVTGLEVTAPDGRTDRLRPPFAPYTGTGAPGVYTVRELGGPGRVTRFAVGVSDPAVSRIAPGALALPTEDVDNPPVVRLPRGTLELWPWVAGAVLVAVVAEWMLYLRGGFLRRRRPAAAP